MRLRESFANVEFPRHPVAYAKSVAECGFWCLAAGALLLAGAGFLALVTVVQVMMLIVGVGLLILGVLFAVNLDVKSTFENDKSPMPFVDGGAGPIGGG